MINFIFAVMCLGCIADNIDTECGWNNKPKIKYVGLEDIPGARDKQGGITKGTL